SIGVFRVSHPSHRPPQGGNAAPHSPPPPHLASPPRPHLVLIGFMGAGKSTVSRLTAALARAPFIDLDAASRAPHATTRPSPSTPAPPRSPIPPLPPPPAPPPSPRLDSAAPARALPPPPPTAIAAGGGALLSPENRTLALTTSRVITLTAPPETLLA